MALWRSQEAISVSSRRERSGRDVNSIGGTGYTGILLFLKILKGGRERHDREGLVSSNSSSWLSSAEGCLWERRLYRVRAVWIQTRFSGLEGALQAAVDIAGSKVDTTSLARLQLSLYDYPRTSYHWRFLSRRKGIGAALPHNPPPLSPS